MDSFDMSDVWDEWDEGDQLGTIQVHLPRIGTYVAYEGKQYVVLQTTTHQEEDPDSDQLIPMPTIATFATILRVDDEGDDLGEQSITVRVDQIRLI